MSATDIAAWYAAAVATAVFLWDIVKWIRSGPRVKISARSNVTYPDGRVVEREQAPEGERNRLAEYCHIELVNLGAQPTTIINIEATHKAGASGVQVGASGIAFTPHVGSSPLPALLGPGGLWSARIEMSHLQIISKHGAPFIRVRVSHRRKPVEVRVNDLPALAANGS
jgi:hypothetical protein